MNRYTYKALEAELPKLNETLARIGDPLRFVIGSRYNYTAIDLATPEQLENHCCQRMLDSGTPRECLSACHRYIAQRV